MSEMTALAARLASLRDAKDEAEGKLKDINGEIAKVEEELWGLMLDEEVSSFKHDGRNFVLVTKSYPSLPRENLAAFCEWLDARGEGDVAPRGVNVNSLGKWYRDRLDAGEDVPAELLSIFERRSIQVRR